MDDITEVERVGLSDTAGNKQEGTMKKLPSSTVRLIGSTQVITSPLSVVKELVENALDADSTNIQIKLENYGFDKIEVRDNGSGIKANETEFMGQPHFTSKISSHTDLEELVTYGFRGEALGSLCAVSDVAITTKTADDIIGYTYRLDHKGQIKTKTPSHMGQGTTVLAANLFKELPVRRQFYNTTKKKKDCLKSIEDLVMAFGVIHPEIRLTLHHNKEGVWQKNVVANHRMVLLNILGSTCVNCMEYHDYHDEEVDIESYLPRPSSSVQVTGRTVTDRTFIFVNKRPVINKDIEKLLKKYYSEGTKSDTARYPIAFVSLVVTPAGLDVNLNPNKTQVLFHQKESILAALESLLSDMYGALGENTKGKDPKNVDLRDDNDNIKRKQNENDYCDADFDKAVGGVESQRSEDGSENFTCLDVTAEDSSKPGLVESHFKINNDGSGSRRQMFCRDELEITDPVKKVGHFDLGAGGVNSDCRGKFHDACDGFLPGVASGGDNRVSMKAGQVIEVMDDTPSSDRRFTLDMLDVESTGLKCAAETTAREVIGSGLGNLHSVSNNCVHQGGQVQQEKNVIEDFSEIFEHPLLQDLGLQSGKTSERLIEQQSGFTFSDMNLKRRTDLESEDDVAMGLDRTEQPSFSDQFKILSGGYDRGGGLMGPKGDDLSLLGQRRISADSEASRDSGTGAAGETESDFTSLQTGIAPAVLVGGKQLDHVSEEGTGEPEQTAEKRLSLSDTWSKGRGLVDSSGKHVEPVKILTARPSIAMTPKASIPEKLSRSVSKKVSAELSAGQKTLIETMKGSLPRPQTAFEMFAKDHEDIVKQDNPDADKIEVKVILKQRWANLDRDSKKQYEEMEFGEREQYWHERLAREKEKKRKEAEEKYVEEADVKLYQGTTSKPPSKKRKVEKICIDDSKPEERDGIVVSFSMADIKTKFSGGFRMTQSKSPKDPPELIGPIKSLGIWTCCHDKKLLLFNHWRAQEMVLYHNMMENHKIGCEPLEKPITLDLDASLITVLDNLKQVQYLPDTNHYIEDERLMRNGFRLKKNGETNDYEVIQMSSIMAFYGVSDLTEILRHIDQNPNAALKDCRPLKVINYFKGEAVRLSRQLSDNMGRGDMKDIMDRAWEILPHGTDSCLHAKPIRYVLYDLDQLPGTQYTQG